MAGFKQRELAIGIRAQARNDAAEVYSEARFGKQQLEASDYCNGCADLLLVDAQAFSKLAQDAVHLALFFFAQPHQLVIEVDGFERLDEQRVSRPAGSMNNA